MYCPRSESLGSESMPGVWSAENTFTAAHTTRIAPTASPLAVMGRSVRLLTVEVFSTAVKCEVVVDRPCDICDNGLHRWIVGEFRFLDINYGDDVTGPVR